MLVQYVLIEVGVIGRKNKNKKQPDFQRVVSDLKTILIHCQVCYTTILVIVEAERDIVHSPVGKFSADAFQSCVGVFRRSDTADDCFRLERRLQTTAIFDGTIEPLGEKSKDDVS